LIARISNSALTRRHSDSSAAPVSFDGSVDHLPRAGRLQSRSQEFCPFAGGSIPTGGPSEGAHGLPTWPPHSASGRPRDHKTVQVQSGVKRRRFPRRAALRDAVKTDVVNLFRFKLAQYYIDSGLTLNLAATRLGMSPSHLCILRKRYHQGGYSAVAPRLKEVFPPALEFDLGMFLPI
jgi:hypothetical protein